MVFFFFGFLLRMRCADSLLIVEAGFASEEVLLSLREAVGRKAEAGSLHLISSLLASILLVYKFSKA